MGPHWLALQRMPTDFVTKVLNRHHCCNTLDRETVLYHPYSCSHNCNALLPSSCFGSRSIVHHACLYLKNQSHYHSKVTCSAELGPTVSLCMLVFQVLALPPLWLEAITSARSLVPRVMIACMYLHTGLWFCGHSINVQAHIFYYCGRGGTEPWSLVPLPPQTWFINLLLCCRAQKHDCFVSAIHQTVKPQQLWVCSQAELSTRGITSAMTFPEGESEIRRIDFWENMADR